MRCPGRRLQRRYDGAVIRRWLGDSLQLTANAALVWRMTQVSVTTDWRYAKDLRDNYSYNYSYYDIK